MNNELVYIYTDWSNDSGKNDIDVDQNRIQKLLSDINPNKALGPMVYMVEDSKILLKV